MVPYGVCTFCDDIRFEHQNKLSLIGCYGADLLLHDQPPVVLPKLCILIQVRTPAERFPDIRITVSSPGVEEPIFAFDNPGETQDFVPSLVSDLEAQGIDATDVEPMRGILLPLVFTPAPVAKLGYMKVRMDYGEQKGIRLGALAIKYQPIPNPSSTS